MKHKTTSNNQAAGPLIAIAACSMVLTTSSEIQLMPAGLFKAFDGRPGIVDGKPTGIPAWHIDDNKAAALVAAINARPNQYVIDYEHQTLKAKDNGQPAPAAGWFSTVEWRPGQGLFATDVVWTAPAKQMIENEEYKFISPVLAYDNAGAVVGLLMAAITNFPAILGMDEIMLAAATAQFAALSTPVPQQQEIQLDLDALLEQLRWMLNLPISATAEDVQAELTKLANMLKEGRDANTAAATGDVIGLINGMRANVAALSGATPDPAKWVPIETMNAMHQQIAALTANANTVSLDETVRAALASGKLLPAQEAWARNLGANNMAALTAFLGTTPTIAALNGMQTVNVPPNSIKPGVAALTADQKSLCAAFGVSEEQYATAAAALSQG
ncbi:phage protease, partial [Pseudoduganella sp. RAF53_2]|uniref:phage protease n=1 Tax=unclassified Pseudoduganella TaxID=2637179 RepID=UPI003F95A817